MTFLDQIGLTIFSIALILIFYQFTATFLDDYRYQQPGKLIDIGDYKLHLNCTGKGGPIVVLDAGLSGTSLGWSLVQPEVAKFTSVCSYDRAGYAWSESSLLKRTSRNIAKELYTVLQNANIPGPYILVGHSFGGCNMLVFADLYPEETLGIILVDSVHEDMLKKLPTMHQGFFNRIIKHSTIQWLLAVLGYKRLKGPSKEIEQMFRPLPDNIQRMYISQMNKTCYTKTVSQEMNNFSESLLQLTECTSTIQDKPIIIISAGIHSNEEEGEIWNALQKKLLTKSHRAKQVIAKKSDHMILHHEPAIIIDAIKEMYAQFKV